MIEMTPWDWVQLATLAPLALVSTLLGFLIELVEFFALGASELE